MIESIAGLPSVGVAGVTAPTVLVLFVAACCSTCRSKSDVRPSHCGDHQPLAAHQSVWQ